MQQGSANGGAAKKFATTGRCGCVIDGGGIGCSTRVVCKFNIIAGEDDIHNRAT
jgi:hypothetical protein